jgi:hypothetical protein
MTWEIRTEAQAERSCQLGARTRPTGSPRRTPSPATQRIWAPGDRGPLRSPAQRRPRPSRRRQRPRLPTNVRGATRAAPHGNASTSPIQAMFTPKPSIEKRVVPIATPSVPTPPSRIALGFGQSGISVSLLPVSPWSNAGASPGAGLEHSEVEVLVQGGAASVLGVPG